MNLPGCVRVAEGNCQVAELEQRGVQHLAGWCLPGALLLPMCPPLQIKVRFLTFSLDSKSVFLEIFTNCCSSVCFISNLASLRVIH